MYAVIRTGGKQYRVKTGDVLEIEHLSVKDPKVSFKPILVSTDDGRTLHGREAGDFTVAAKMLGDASAQLEPQPEPETSAEPEPETTGEPEPAAEAAASGA